MKTTEGWQDKHNLMVEICWEQFTALKKSMVTSDLGGQGQGQKCQIVSFYKINEFIVENK